MKNVNLSWKFLIPFGVVCEVIAYSGDSVVNNAIGVLGHLVLLIGIVNLVSEIIKSNKTQ